MQRKLIDYLVLSLKGMAMGAADAVPGVSGGTIALISAIYQELVTTIGNINFSLFKTLKNEGFQSFWKQLNGNFLLALVSGIFVSFIIFMRIAKYLIEHHPILIWSFFFGLIIASIYFVGKQISKWNIATIIALIFGTFIAFYVSTLPSLADNESPYFMFIAGALAICAMILPGISGAFILVILGAYKTLSDALHNFDIQKLIFFFLGAFVGLLSFSKLLKWLFKKFEDITLAVLTGFIIGSLNKIWPWKKIISTRISSDGIEEPVLTQSISPFSFDGEPQLTFAIALMLIGFLTIFILEKIGSTKS